MGGLRGYMVVVMLCVHSRSSVKPADVPCQPPNTTEYFNSLPGMPSLADNFHVWVEIKADGSNKSELVEETVMYSYNLAALRILSNGVETKTIFSYDTQETFVVTGTNCTVHNISAEPYLFIVGEQISDGMAYLPTGATSLFFGPLIVKVYAGKETVRGMDCDRWHACVSTARMNFTVDYYFTVHDWQTPSGYPQVPVRYVVQGQQALNPGSPSTFSRVYEFFGYEAENNIDQTVFETPRGVVCPGRKSLKDIPQITSKFYHYRVETVDGVNTLVTGAEVWYDYESKMYRYDYHLPNASPMSEVHDFNFGARYQTDVYSGRCTPMALDENSPDSKLNVQAFQSNGSYSLSMKDPLAFFFLDSNFTYSGQRKTRDIMCDVFSSRRSNFDYFDNGIVYTATVEAYFLYDGVDMAVDSYEPSQTNVPLRVELTIPALNKDIVFNIFDFDTDRPEFEVFDVTNCFESSAKLDFRVRFPGTYNSDTEHIVKLKGQNILAQTLQVSPLRVTHVQIEYDGSYLYLLASLLDRTPSLVQFTRLLNTVIEKNDDSQFANISSAAACSDLCVQNPEFQCKSFEYCPNDRQGCRLSRSHISDGGASVVPSQCDLYSRTVNPLNTIEPSIEDAYSNLLNKLWTPDFAFSIPQDDQSEIAYVAVASEILFGQYDTVQLPSLPTKFSYRMEIVYPQTTYVDVYDVWYDSTSQLVRIDFRSAVPGPPYYTPYTVSRIHDFSRGIAFDIDTHQGNCTIHPIQNFGDFDAQVLNISRSGAGIDMVSMKSPSQLFHLDNTYAYTGQKTVRGILCDVFESARSDFHVGGTDGNMQHSIFQYFFQASDWSYIADNHNDVTMQAPVMLTLSDTEANTYLIYNFFDFNDQHLTYQNFDVSPCFSDKQRIDFVIDFNQTYYPYLATGEWSFKEQAQLQLSSLLRITPLRLQDLQVTYNSGQTFLVGTLLDYVPPQFYFIEDGSTAPYHATQLVPDSNVISCANACYDSNNAPCNSFDYCNDGNCLLSTLHVPDGNATGKAERCRHFSRLTNATYSEPPLEKAYDIMKDVVYKGLLVIQIPIIGNESQIAIYTAMGIRNDILRSKPPSDTEEGDFSKFTLTTHNMMLFNSRLVLSGIAVDDCASACLNEQFFDCEAFDYCYIIGDCYLYDFWSDDAKNLDNYNSCDIFRRLYTDEFTEYPGQILESVADAILKASSVEICAKECFLGIGYHNTCRSFDFCPSTNDCLIRHVHMMDVEPSSVGKSSTCTHYSRDYLYDFDQMTNKELPGHDDMIFKDVSPSKCAGLCLDDLNCQSFEFCAGECHLSSTSAKLNPNVTVSGTCDLYIMQDSAKIVDRALIITSQVSHPGVVSVPATQSSPSTSKVQHQSTSQAADRATTITSQVPLAGATSVPATKSIPLTSKTLSSQSTSMARTPVTNNQNYKLTSVQTSPPTNINNGKGCKQQKVGGSSNDTGPRAAIAFGVLILGIVVGSVSMQLFFRFRVGRPGGDTMELFSKSH